MDVVNFDYILQYTQEITFMKSLKHHKKSYKFLLSHLFGLTYIHTGPRCEVATRRHRNIEQNNCMQEN